MGFSLTHSVRGYESIQKINEADYTPRKVSANNNCIIQYKPPVGTAAKDDVLYLFNNKDVKIAILNDPKLEKQDDSEFIRVLFNATIKRRDINNQIYGSRYVLSEHTVEDYKYKFSSYLSEQINSNAGCDVSYNITYRMNDVKDLCDKAKDHIQGKIDGERKRFAYIDVDMYIKPRSMFIIIFIIYINIIYSCCQDDNNDERHIIGFELF